MCCVLVLLYYVLQDPVWRNKAELPSVELVAIGVIVLNSDLIYANRISGRGERPRGIKDLAPRFQILHLWR